MIPLTIRSSLLVLAIVVALLSGCGRKSEGVVTYGSKDSLDARPATVRPDPHAGHDHGGGHAHRPLMGGELVELGDHEFNLELKFDAARGVLQAWVLDAHAENFVRVGMASFDVREAAGARRLVTLQAVGNSITGETPGDTSAFEGAAPWLREFNHFDGVVVAVKVRGAEFRDVPIHLHP